MTQAIAGVSPSSVEERTVMVVWPSNAVYRFGRWLGKRYAWQGPVSENKIFWIGNVFVLLSIPAALAMYFLRIAPGGWGIRYRLTNRRVIVERGVSWKESRSVGLDQFDSVTIEVVPGQEWYNAGDLVFRKGDTVVFRLEAVSRPEAFRETLVKSHMAYVGVKKAMSVA